MIPGTHRYPPQEPVVYGKPAADAVTEIADRFGAAAGIAPLLFTGALGLAAIGLKAGNIHDAPSRVLVISGLLLTGVAYGGLQNLTLAQAFTAAGEQVRSSVSIAWNLSFDAGTGLGAFAAGGLCLL